MNKKIVYSLIFLIVIYFIAISFYTFLQFQIVTHFTKVYTSNNWKIGENNGLRVAFLRYMNKTSFLPFKLRLDLIKEDKKINLINQDFNASLFNKNIYIDNNIKEGNAILNGKITYENKLVDNFKIKIKLEKEFKKGNIKIWNEKFIDEKTGEESIVKTFSDFKAGKYEMLKDTKIKLFSLTKKLIFSDNNKVFFLTTLPDYTPVKIKGKIFATDFYKDKTFNIETDQNGLATINTPIYNSYGKLLFTGNGLNIKIPFHVSNQKTAIFSEKLLYFNKKHIKLKIRAFKNIESLYFSAFIDKHWIDNRKVDMVNKKAFIDFEVPNKFIGFIDFVVYRSYSYGSDLSSLKVFIGSKEDLNKRLLELDNHFITSTIQDNRENELFYQFAISQIDTDFKDPQLQFDSFKIQENRIKRYQKKYSTFLWIILLIISILILFLIFLMGFLAIKENDDNSDYDFRVKGKFLYLFFFIFMLSLFLGMILFILKLI